MATKKKHVSSQHWHKKGGDSNQQGALYDERNALRSDLIRLLVANISADKLAAKHGVELTETVQSYNASLFALQTIRAETESFIETLCARHFRTNQPHLARREYTDATATVLSSADKPADYLSLPAVRVSVNLEPGLFGLSAAEGTEQLAGDLRKVIEQFVDGFCQVLARMVEIRVLGTIEWPVPTACRIRYFHTQVDATREREIETETRKENRNWRQTIRETEVNYTLHGQQQHLAHARRIELPTYRGSMPIRVRQLCDTVPIWLTDRIDIVDGQLFRSDHVEEHLRTESQAELVEETQLSFLDDPAITLGPFVLATWLPQEVVQEQQQVSRESYVRQQEIEHQQTQARLQSYKPLAIAAALQTVPLVVQTLAIWRWPFLHMGCIATALLLVIPGLVLLRRTAIAHTVRLGPTVFLIAGGSAMTCVVGLHLLLLAVAYSSGTLLLLASILACIGMFLGHELATIFRPK